MKKFIAITVLASATCALFYCTNPTAYAFNSMTKEYACLAFADIEKQIHAINTL